MPNTLLRRAAVLALAPLAITLASCSEEPSSTALLEHVPADSPYVFAASQPLPEPLYSRLMAVSALQLDDAQREWRELAQRLAEQQGDGAPMPAEADTFLRVMEALAAELAGKMDAQGMQELGFGRDSDSVFYGLSLFPVLRGEVADPARVEALLARIEQRSGVSAPRAEFAGQSYRRVPLGDKLLLVVALQDRYLVTGVLPVQGEQQLLPLLLGMQRPEASLARAGTLGALQKTYGYSGFGEGYVDIQAVSAILTGRRSGGLDGHWQALATDLPRPSPGCQGLLDQVTDGVPRLVAGITDVDANGYALTAAYETAPQVSAHLQRLAHPRPLPGMGADADALFSLGVDIDIPALREAIKALLRFVATAGSDCEWVDPQQLQAAQPKLDLVLGPMLGGLKGAYAELGELRVDHRTLDPASASGGVLLAVDDPQGVLAMAAMANPALAQLQLPLDGSAQAVPAELLPPEMPAMHVAAQPGLLAIAVGADSASRAPALLGAGSSDTPMLMGASYDMARFMGVMATLMELLAERMELAGELEQAQEMRAQAASFAASAGQLGRMELSVAPDARGLLLRQQVRLQ